MAEIWIGKNLANDPWATTTDDISEYYHVQSTGWGGLDKAVTVPSVNYPVVTPARIFVELPMVIDRSDLTGSRSIKVVDTTIGSTMTRVATAPTGNEYRIPPASSIRRDVIEVSSTKAGNVLDFDYYGEGSVFNASEFNTFRQFFAQTTIVSNYTITDTDGLGTIFVGHTSTTALVTATLPTVADNTERIIRIQNTGDGLTKVDGEGAETISLNGTAVASVYLYSEDDYIELVSNGSEWKILRCFMSMITEGINRSDWTNVHIGSAFTYDNKSAAIDFTGKHITEATSSQTAIVVYDSGGTGLSGILYVYNIGGSGDGIWTNNREVTAGDGAYTLDVNEGSGTSKNIDYNIYHLLGININYFDKKILMTAATTFSYTACRELNFYAQPGVEASGWQLIQVDTDYIQLQTASNRACGYIADNGSITIIESDDYSFCFILSLKI